MRAMHVHKWHWCGRESRKSDDESDDVIVEIDSGDGQMGQLDDTSH
jgi:hypothetical protein